jgi:hypothetical protein
MLISAQITLRNLPKTAMTVPRTAVAWANHAAITPKSIMLPQPYSVNQLPFFCKIEAKLEKKINLPIKFRLGEVDYVDWLEGKHSSYSIPKN